MTLVKHVIRLQREKEMLTSFSESKKEGKTKKCKTEVFYK